MSLLSCASGPLHTVSVAVKCIFDGWPTPRRVVQVEFYKSGDCFVIPPGTSVALNGQLLELVSAGARRQPSTDFGPGFRNPGKLQGIDLAIPNCEPALFRSQEFVPTPARRDELVIQMSGDTGRIEIESLLAERTVSVVSGPVQRGKPVTLQWAPRSDVWPSQLIDPEVKIADNQRQISIMGPALHARRGQFQFEMPQVTSNRVKVTVEPGSQAPYAPVKVCRGIGECVSKRVVGPSPIDIDVMTAP
jgi:hypothetical protein